MFRRIASKLVEALIVASSLLYLAEMTLGAVSWLLAALVAIGSTAGVLIVDWLLVRELRGWLGHVRRTVDYHDLDRAA